MAFDAHKNFCKVLVSMGYNASAVSIILASGHGAFLPVAPFNLTWWDSTDYVDPSDDPNVEIVRVTAITVDTLTIMRGQEGTDASTHNIVGSQYEMVLAVTAKMLTDIENFDSPSATYSNPSTPLVGVLRAGRVSAALTILSDSTDMQVTDWGPLIAQMAAVKYPAYTIDQMWWDEVNDAWLDSTTVATGAQGSRYLVSTGGHDTCVFLNSIVPSITGDLTLDLDFAPDSWNSGATQSWYNKMSSIAGNFCFRFQINSSGGIQFNWSADGTNLHTISTISPNFVDGTRHWIRITMDVDNGSSGSTGTFYTSSDGVTWTMLGTPQVSSGTTSFFASNANWELFGWGGSIENCPGKIYHVRAKAGIAGQNKLPQEVEYWYSGTNEIGGIIGFGGSPTLTIENGGYSGATIDTWDDPTRIAKALIWPYAPILVVSLGHNEGSFGSYYTGRLDSLLTAIRTRYANAGVIMIGQNPRVKVAGQNYTWQFDTRNPELWGWCEKNSCLFLNVYQAFFDDGRPLSVLVDTDGIHPTPAGQVVWANTAFGSLLSI